jgi:ankyrin repeat protein
MAAVKVARIEQIKILLAEGANPNVRSNDALRWSDMPIDKGGNTAGHFALYYGNNPVVEDIVVGLIGNGGDFGIRNNAGDQPIHYLEEIQSNEVRIRIITFLMANGVDIFTQGYNGDTILHQAVDKNDIAWIELLYKLIGSAITGYTVKNGDGLTPLELARHNLNTDVEEVLLSIEAEVVGDESENIAVAV